MDQQGIAVRTLGSASHRHCEQAAFQQHELVLDSDHTAAQRRIACLHRNPLDV